MTFSVWKALSVSIPTIASKYKGNVKRIDDIMKLWINTLKDYKDTMWRAKPVSIDLNLDAFAEKLVEVKRVLGQVEEIKIISKKISEEIDM